MSFFDNLTRMASSLLGNVSPEQATQAASDHVADTDPNELAGHLQSSLGTMDASQVGALGQRLLETFTAHPSYQGDGAQAAAEAGTSEAEVASGSPNAVASLIDYARQHPEVLQAASTAFVQRNPEALQQLAPELLSGIMGRLGINPGATPPAEPTN